MVVFALSYWLREFSLSAVTIRFELMCQLKQLMLLHYKYLSLLARLGTTCCKLESFIEGNDLSYMTLSIYRTKMKPTNAIVSLTLCGDFEP